MDCSTAQPLHADDAKLRTTIVAVLLPSAVPVLPVIELIASYACPFRAAVSTVGPAATTDSAAVSRVVYPTAVCVASSKGSTGADCVVVADAYAHCFWRMDAKSGHATVYAGRHEGAGHALGTSLDSRFFQPRAICADPTNRNRFYLADAGSIRVLARTPAANGSSDGSGDSGVVTLIAGSAVTSMKDGVGSNAAFHFIRDLLCTADGRVLYATDGRNDRVRAIDLTTRDVRTVVRDGFRVGCRSPKCLAFDRTASTSANATPQIPSESALLFTCSSGIRRYDLATGDACDLPIARPSPLVQPWGIVSPAAAPILLVSCVRSHSIYAVAWQNGGTAELIAGAGRSSGDEAGHGKTDGCALGEGGATFWKPHGLTLFESERANCRRYGESIDSTRHAIT